MTTLVIPRPIAEDAYTFACDHCACLWTEFHGSANRVSDACDDGRCPCHSEIFQTIVYEGHRDAA